MSSGCYNSYPAIIFCPWNLHNCWFAVLNFHFLFLNKTIFFCMVRLPLFGKEGSGTPVFKVLVRALNHLQTRLYHGSKHYEPWSDCSQGSSLMWVQTVGYLIRTKICDSNQVGKMVTDLSIKCMQKWTVNHVDTANDLPWYWPLVKWCAFPMFGDWYFIFWWSLSLLSKRKIKLV